MEISTFDIIDDCYRVAVVITASDYCNLRKQGFVGFYDIEETEDDFNTQTDGVKHLGFAKIITL